MAPRSRVKSRSSAKRRDVGPEIQPPYRWWLIAFVAAMFFSFPHPLRFAPFEDGAVLDLGLLVSWAVVPLLVRGIEGLPMARAVRRGFIWTVLANGLVLHFIYVVTVHYGHAPVVVGLVAPFALGCYSGALGGVFAAAWVWLRRIGLDGPFTVALLWTVMDYLRSMAFTGWPWATLGYAQHLNPALMGLAQFASVYGLSFATVLGGAGLFTLARTRGRGLRARAGFAALAVVLLLHVFGWAFRIVPGENDGMAEETIRIAAVQGNIEQGMKWDPDNYRRTLEQYERLTRQAAEDGAEIIVWPETAVPGVMRADPSVVAWLERLSSQTDAILLVGSVGADFDRDSGRILRFYDSVFLVNPWSGIVAHYDKTHLVPFGEYVPFRPLLGRFLGSVASGIATGDVTPGEEVIALDFDRSLPLPGSAEVGPPLDDDPLPPVRLGTPICYELLFPDLVRRFVSDGGGMLLATTNDAWYGRTGAPYQFLAITKLRSAETGVFTVRAANTGVSAVIDSAGQIRARIPIFEPGILVADVPYREGGQPGEGTFYVRHGDVFARGCCLVLAVLAVVATARSRRRADPPASGR